MRRPPGPSAPRRVRRAFFNNSLQSLPRPPPSSNPAAPGTLINATVFRASPALVQHADSIRSATVMLPDVGILRTHRPERRRSTLGTSCGTGAAVGRRHAPSLMHDGKALPSARDVCATRAWPRPLTNSFPEARWPSGSTAVAFSDFHSDARLTTSAEATWSAGAVAKAEAVALKTSLFLEARRAVERGESCPRRPYCCGLEIGESAGRR